MSRGIANNGIFIDTNSRESVVATTSGESRVFQCDPHVEWYRWVQSQCLADAVLQVRHVLQIIIRWRLVSSHLLHDFPPKFSVRMRMGGKLLEKERQCTRSRVAARKQDVHDLIPDDCVRLPSAVAHCPERSSALPLRSRVNLATD